jgi:hypothetical protein
VGVAAEIGQHRIRAGQGGLGVDDPVNVGEVGKASGEDRRFAEHGEHTGEAHIIGSQRRAQPGHEHLAEAP